MAKEPPADRRLRASHTLARGCDETEACPGPPQIRRRGAALEQAIYDAVLDQISGVGFVGLTMEGVAAAAHTGKAALYRRWACKEDLVIDTLNHALPSFGEPPDTGDVRADIAELIRRLLVMVNGSSGCMIQALLSELHRDHEFLDQLRKQVIEPRKKMMLEILRRGAARGEVRPEAVDAVVADAGPALILHQLFTHGAPVDPAYANAVLERVVFPLVCLSAPRQKARTQARRSSTTNADAAS